MLVILVPVNLLWRVKISLRRKLALASLFSVTILIMVFAIVRVAVVSAYSHQPDQTWLFLWDSIEQTVGKCSFEILQSLTPRFQMTHSSS